MTSTITRHNPAHNPFDPLHSNPNAPNFSSNKVPNLTRMQFQTQGQTNACGTTSLTMILQYWQGSPLTHDDIDREIRRLDTFSAPTDLISYAESAGLNGEMYTGGSALELTRFIDRGVPVQLLVTSDGSGDVSKSHYVVATSYEVESDGSISFRLHDPNYGHEVKWSAATLEDKWGDTPANFDHFFLAYAPPGINLPPSRIDGIEGALAAIDGAASVIAGADRVAHGGTLGERARGVGDLAVGLPEVFGGVISGVGQIGADYAAKKAEGTPVVGEPLALGLRQLENQLGTLAQELLVVSQAGARANRGVEHLLEGHFEAAFNDFCRVPLDVVRGTAGVLEDFAEDSLEGVRDLPGALLDVGEDLGEELFGALDPLAHSVEAAASAAGSATLDAFDLMGNGVYDASSYLLWSMLRSGAVAGEAAESALRTLSSGVNTAANTVAQGVSKGAEAVVDGVEAAGSAIANGASDMGSAIANGASDVGSAVVDGVSDVGSAIADGAGSAVDKASDALDDVVDFVGGWL